MKTVTCLEPHPSFLAEGGPDKVVRGCGISDFTFWCPLKRRDAYRLGSWMWSVLSFTATLLVFMNQQQPSITLKQKIQPRR